MNTSHAARIQAVTHIQVAASQVVAATLAAEVTQVVAEAVLVAAEADTHQDADNGSPDFFYHLHK